MGNILHYRVQVAVKTRFLPEQSEEAENRFVFAYTITITNEGDQAIKLLSRHWVITDSNNNMQEIKGKGVVGEQPTIKPGQSFEYTSGTVLSTQVGVMSGSYQMTMIDSGSEFSVPIPQFVLSIPRILH